MSLAPTTAVTLQCRSCGQINTFSIPKDVSTPHRLQCSSCGAIISLNPKPQQQQQAQQLQTTAVTDAFAQQQLPPPAPGMNPNTATALLSNPMTLGAMPVGGMSMPMGTMPGVGGIPPSPGMAPLAHMQQQQAVAAAQAASQQQQQQVAHQQWLQQQQAVAQQHAAAEHQAALAHQHQAAAAAAQQQQHAALGEAQANGRKRAADEADSEAPPPPPEKRAKLSPPEGDNADVAPAPPEPLPSATLPAATSSSNAAMDLTADGTTPASASEAAATHDIPNVAPLGPDAASMLLAASSSSGALTAEGAADVVNIDEDDEGVAAAHSVAAVHAHHHHHGIAADVHNVNVPPLARSDIEDVPQNETPEQELVRLRREHRRLNADLVAAGKQFTEMSLYQARSISSLEDQLKELKKENDLLKRDHDTLASSNKLLLKRLVDLEKGNPMKGGGSSVKSQRSTLLRSFKKEPRRSSSGTALSRQSSGAPSTPTSGGSGTHHVQAMTLASSSSTTAMRANVAVGGAGGSFGSLPSTPVVNPLNIGTSPASSSMMPLTAGGAEGAAASEGGAATSFEPHRLRPRKARRNTEGMDDEDMDGDEDAPQPLTGDGTVPMNGAAAAAAAAEKKAAKAARREARRAKRRAEGLEDEDSDSDSSSSSDDSDDDDDASKAAQASKYFPFAPPPPLEKSGGVKSEPTGLRPSSFFPPLMNHDDDTPNPLTSSPGGVGMDSDDDGSMMGDEINDRKGSGSVQHNWVCTRDGCGKNFQTSWRLRRHLKAHERGTTRPPVSEVLYYLDAMKVDSERVDQIRRCLEGPHRALAMEKLRAVVEDSVDFSPGHGCGWSTGEEELAIDLYCGLKALSQEKHRIDVIAKLLARTSRAVKTRLHLLMQAKWTTFVQKALESCPNRSGTIEDVCDRVYDHMLPALTGLADLTGDGTAATGNSELGEGGDKTGEDGEMKDGEAEGSSTIQMTQEQREAAANAVGISRKDPRVRSSVARTLFALAKRGQIGQIGRVFHCEVDDSLE